MFRSLFRNKNIITSPNDATERMLRFYLLFSAVALFLTAEMAVFTKGNSIHDSLFWNGNSSDHFMDLFNSIRDARDLTWVYQRNVIYPPLSILIMYFFSKILPREVVFLRFAKRSVLQRSQSGQMLYFFFALICLLSFAYMLDRYMRIRGLKKSRYAVILFCFISFPVIYCFERGNTTLLAMVFCMFFIFFRNSESRGVREASYIMLALAAGLKLFPATLGILLLYEKKYKAAARTVFYGVAALAIPYLIILLLTPDSGGIAAVFARQQAAAGNNKAMIMPILPLEIRNSDGSKADPDGSLMRFVKNIFRWIGKRSSFSYNSAGVADIVYILQRNKIINKAQAQKIAIGAFIGSEILMGGMGFFCKKEWQRTFIGVYLMLNIHSISMHYTMVYLVPVFIVFLLSMRDRERPGVMNWLYFALFGVQIMTIPYMLIGIRTTINKFLATALHLPKVASFNKMLTCVAFQLFAAIVAADILVSLIWRLMQKRNLVVLNDDLSIDAEQKTPRPKRTKRSRDLELDY
ncbi:MAG: DUF2029 domain-containing protein [Clostridia bacterium]|nr:DUF2029 domain-containing protein [Clostridia bacterium]